MRLNLKEILQKFRQSRLKIVAILFFILILLVGFVYFRQTASYIKYDQYEKLLESGTIKKALIIKDRVYLSTSNRQFIILKEAIDIERLCKEVAVASKEPMSFVPFFVVAGFILLFILLYKKRPQRVDKFIPNSSSGDEHYIINYAMSSVKFSDVAGIKELKDELFEIVDFIKNRKKYSKLGINLPKGVLLFGPPGVGKTLIAKALAGEAGVPFFYQSGASFSQTYVGVGAKRVRELFARAKSEAPSIIFIDEIDSVGKSRGGDRNDEREATLNELLTQMDGFDENSGVLVVAATNKIEMIDEALLRAGRFDRHLYLLLPDFSDRKEILQVHLRAINAKVNLDYLAKISVGFSGAAIATFVNEAAIHAFRRGGSEVVDSDFEAVKNRVSFGKKKSINLSEDEKKIQSIYQGAKAATAYIYKVPFNKISLFEDDFLLQDRQIESREWLEKKIEVLLSGSVAMRIFKDDLFSNASSDLKKAKEIAQKMVFEYGMVQIVPSDKDVENLLKECEKALFERLQKSKEIIFEVSEIIFRDEKISFDEVSRVVKEHE